VSGLQFQTEHGPSGFDGPGGERLIRARLDASDRRRVAETEELFQGVYGRLRDVVMGPDGALYVATSNRDGRGRPRPGDDRILRIVEIVPVH
jgi:glucose/arabinose dehydrogenase